MCVKTNERADFCFKLNDRNKEKKTPSNRHDTLPMHIEQRNDGECVCARKRNRNRIRNRALRPAGIASQFLFYPFLSLFYTFFGKIYRFFFFTAQPLAHPSITVLAATRFRAPRTSSSIAFIWRFAGPFPRLLAFIARALCVYVFPKANNEKKNEITHTHFPKKRYKTAAHTFTIFALNVLCNIGHIFTPRVVPSKACVTAICFAIFPPRTNRSCMCVPLHSMSFFFFALSPSAWGEHFHGRFVSISSFWVLAYAGWCCCISLQRIIRGIWAIERRQLKKTIQKTFESVKGEDDTGRIELAGSCLTAVNRTI